MIFLFSAELHRKRWQTLKSILTEFSRLILWVRGQPVKSSIIFSPKVNDGEELAGTLPDTHSPDHTGTATT